MILPTSLRFELANGITEKQAKESKYVIYAHKCSGGIYVGLAEDAVKRWQIHVQDSMNEHSNNYKDTFKAALRKCGHGRFTHYIIAVADFEKAAKSKEASAIDYYGVNLNMRAESQAGIRDYGFRPLDAQITKSVVIAKKSREGVTHSRGDNQRRTITAEIYEELGRKRVRSLTNPHFPAGLRVECSRAERARFNTGDKVRINVALSEKDGRKYLVAAKTAAFIPVVD